MPHDKNAKLIGVGDSVFLTARVKSVDSESDHGCNVTLVIANEPTSYQPVLVMNSRWVEAFGEVSPDAPIVPIVPKVDPVIVDANMSALFPYPTSVPGEVWEIAIDSISNGSAVNARTIHAVAHVVMYGLGRWLPDNAVVNLTQGQTASQSPKEVLESLRREADVPKFAAPGEHSVNPVVLAGLRLLLQYLIGRLG